MNITSIETGVPYLFLMLEGFLDCSTMVTCKQIMGNWNCLRMTPCLVGCIDHLPFMRLEALTALMQMIWFTYAWTLQTGTSTSKELSRFVSKKELTLLMVTGFLASEKITSLRAPCPSTIYHIPDPQLGKRHLFIFINRHSESNLKGIVCAANLHWAFPSQ